MSIDNVQQKENFNYWYQWNTVTYSVFGFNKLFTIKISTLHHHPSKNSAQNAATCMQSPNNMYFVTKAYFKQLYGEIN